VNTKETSAKADSSTRSVATRRASRRPSKLALFRVKVATIVAAVVLFFASLAGIVLYNPGAASQAAAAVQSEQITVVEPGGTRSLQLAPPPRVSAVRPLVRSRGS
jgi:hypothetical protein